MVIANVMGWKSHERVKAALLKRQERNKSPLGNLDSDKKLVFLILGRMKNGVALVQ